MRSDFRVRRHITSYLQTYINSITADHVHFESVAYQLALCYSLGFGVGLNEEKAFLWLQRSGKSAEYLNEVLQAVIFHAANDEYAHLFQNPTLSILEGIRGLSFVPTYLETEDVDFCIDEYKREIRDTQQVLGKDSKPVFDLQEVLGSILRSAGRLEESRAVHLEQLDVILERLSRHMARILDKASNIEEPVNLMTESFAASIRFYEDRGYTDIAENFSQQLTRLERSHTTAKDLETVYSSLRRLTCLQISLDKALRGHGSLLPKVSLAMNLSKEEYKEALPRALFLASATRGRKRMEMARSALEEVISRDPSQRFRRGQGDCDIVPSLNMRLKDISSIDQEFHKVERLFSELINKSSENPPDLTSLALLHTQQPTWQAACQLLRRSFWTTRDALGENHHLALEASIDLSPIILAQAQAAEKEKAFLMFSEQLDKQVGDESASWAARLRTLWISLWKSGR